MKTIILMTLMLINSSNTFAREFGEYTCSLAYGSLSDEEIINNINVDVFDSSDSIGYGTSVKIPNSDAIVTISLYYWDSTDGTDSVIQISSKSVREKDAFAIALDTFPKKFSFPVKTKLDEYYVVSCGAISE